MTATADQIQPGERRELRSVIRSQYKVLRSEIEERVAQLNVEGDDRIRAKFEAEDKALADLNREIQKVVDRAQARINDLIAKSGIEPEARYNQPGRLRIDHIEQKSTAARRQLRTEFQNAIKARARTAALQIDRQEADALRALAADAIQTEAARRFLDSIPAITQLLPSSHLAEIESQWARTNGGAS